MCGISGWFNLGVQAEQRRPLLQSMCATLVHRGPDDEGYYVDEHAGLGMRRLSIVDLEAGHQPMASADGAVQVVFNGEIYDHAALRAGLKAAGCSFSTHSDTEVILRLYEREGLAGLERMNGMFAIAVWDRRSGTLHLVRDRLGVKPLYYAQVGDALLFGSEIKAILASGRLEKSIDPCALWDYLSFRYVPGPQTIWRGIRKLPPGHRLSVRVDAPLRVERWWDIPIASPAKELSDAEYEAQFAELFEDATRLRMLADVPVGITLSGGLDSSAVVAAVERSSALKTFSVAFRDSAATDELPYAREVARHFGTDHHEILIGQREFMDFLPQFVWHTDEPLADLASVPLHYVCRLAREQVKVVLSGEGSDEILAGYNFERWARLWNEVEEARRGVAAGPFGALAARMSAKAAQRRELAHTVIDQREMAEPFNMTHYWSSAEKQAMLARPMACADSLDRIREQLRRLGPQAPLNQVLYVYCQDWLVEDLLMKADRMSMAASVELRTPFLDYRLVEWAAQLPTRLKAGPNADGSFRSKEILRRYASTRLPPSIIERPKQGFPVPVYDWLSGALKGWAQDILLAAGARVRKWLDPLVLQKLVDAGTRADAATMDRHRLWNLLILEIWMQRWEA